MGTDLQAFKQIKRAARRAEDFDRAAYAKRPMVNGSELRQQLIEAGIIRPAPAPPKAVQVPRPGGAIVYRGKADPLNAGLVPISTLKRDGKLTVRWRRIR